LVKSDTVKASNGYDHIYPPVTFRSTPNPPLPPEKTGSPIAPIKTYTNVAQKASKGDRTTAQTITARSVKDMGTVPTGITKNELTQIIAAKIPQRTVLYSVFCIIPASLLSYFK
jgi:hypothetical protein